jgi:hypothetical protein
MEAFTSSLTFLSLCLDRVCGIFSPSLCGILNKFQAKCHISSWLPQSGVCVSLDENETH